MEYFEVGSRFDSYEELEMRLEELSKETNSRYWKRDARTINACRSIEIAQAIKESLVYFEVKFLCIYAGVTSQARGQRRHKVPRAKTGCPSYLRFKVAADGMSLILVSMNMRHNHKMVLPVKKTVNAVKRERQSSWDGKQEEEETEADSSSEIYVICNEDEDFESIVDSIGSYEEVMDNKEELKNFTFRGLVAPVITPFNSDADRSLNLNVIPKYAQYLLDHGITGILVNGTSGEGMSMNVAERKQVTEAWVKVVATTKQHLMVQIGGAPLPDVIELAKHAEVNKVDSLLCLPELYFKPKTSEDLINYLSIISRAAPNTPLLYYHVPMFTDVNINMGQFLNDVTGKIPTFGGIKFTSTLLDEGLAAVNANNKKYAVFLGADQIMTGAFALGFDSAIATTLNMFANLSIGIKESVKNADLENARAFQNKLNKVIDIITKNGSWVTTMKAAMPLVTKIDCGPPRLPLDQLTDAQIKEMAMELQPYL